MSSKKFVISYFLYVLLSFLFCISVSFTIAAWIIYFVVLAPFYLICLIYVISIAVNKRHSRVRLHKPSFLLLLSVQGMVVLASPASCYGWKQGQACYSLIQALFVNIFTNENLSSFTTMYPIGAL